jgi:hypothetical protein
MVPFLLITDGREVAAGVCRDIHRVQSSKRHEEVLELDVCRVGTGEHVTRFSVSCDETVHQMSHNAAFSSHDVAFYHAGADGVRPLHRRTTVYDIDVNSGDTILVRMEPKVWACRGYERALRNAMWGSEMRCSLDLMWMRRIVSLQETLNSHHATTLPSRFLPLPNELRRAVEPRESADVESTYSLKNGETVAVWWVKPQWDACV